MKRIIFLAFLLLLLNSLTTAQASIIYNNGLPGNGGTLISSPYTIADDFRLDANYVVTGAKVWTLEGTTSPTNVNWFLFSDLPGSPGQVLHSGAATIVSRVPTGSYGSFITYEYELDLNQSLLLDANTNYWFGLRTYGTSSVFWRFSKSDFGIRSFVNSSETFSANWGNTQVERAFQLLGHSANTNPVPEPATAITWSVIAFLGISVVIRQRYMRSL